MATILTSNNLGFAPKNAPAVKFSVSIADAGATGVVQDLGVAGLRNVRGRIIIKSGLGNTNTFAFNVRVDTVVGMTSPELVFQSPTLTYVTNDTYITIDFQGWSYEGFRYLQINGTDSGGTAVYDAQVDAW